MPYRQLLNTVFRYEAMVCLLSAACCWCLCSFRIWSSKSWQKCYVGAQVQQIKMTKALLHAHLCTQSTKTAQNHRVWHMSWCRKSEFLACILCITTHSHLANPCTEGLWHSLVTFWYQSKQDVLAINGLRLLHYICCLRCSSGGTFVQAKPSWKWYPRCYRLLSQTWQQRRLRRPSCSRSWTVQTRLLKSFRPRQVPHPPDCTDHIGFRP